MKTHHYLKMVTLMLLCTFYFNALGQLADNQSKFLGNTHTRGQTPLNFDHYWNQLTPGNAGKWASCEQNRDDFNYWLWLDRAYDHAREFDLVFKEHTLVWGHSSGEPAWMRNVPQNEQMDEVLEWFEALSGRYPDLELIDVVNEPLHAPPSYAPALGGAGSTGWDWVIWSFEQARIYFPNAQLILNEYNVLNYTSTCDDFLEIVELLQDRNLIDGIGLQAHSLESINFSTIQRNMEVMAATGLDIYISELDLRGNDATQLALYQQLFPYFWEHPSVKGVTLWGYLEGDMWRNEAYLLAADGVTERPALQWLKDYFDYDETPGPYVFNTSVDGGGSLILSPQQSSYASGSSVTATAVPDPGYEFSNWSGDVGGSTNPTTISVISNRSLTAHFVLEGVPDTVSLAISVTGSGSVSQTPEGSSFAEGTEITLTATPDSGYVFQGWSGGVSGTSPSITFTIEENTVITATFTEEGTNPSTCENPVTITTPFAQDGAGEFCFITSGPISYINSWNLELLEINGVDYTNTWSNSLPPADNGSWYIHYIGSFPWSHFEAAAPSQFNARTAQAEEPISAWLYPNPVKDELHIRLPQRKATSTYIRLYNQKGMLVKEYTSQEASSTLSTSTLLPGVYLLTIQNESDFLKKKIIRE
ncbi:endo-1,4-beta-xylanase [Fulvivirga maritima]|uniref:endo-1,4-beta-xylanase n=1 Tax=Fulvivirga maritima TaxID=2904247 RepID=UPI001F178E5C|nr:endo-1,4-beta-xylanase [Fulvivirga maritima]UII26909.1 endo-1,4-beta-xylanase [Fulvivirga maritima]